MSMLYRTIFAAAAAAALFPLAPSAAERPDPKRVSITLPDEIQWKKSANADTAVIQGDPSKPGIYIQLIKWHPGNMSRPHYHPEERYIYVISGTWWVGVGPKYDPESTYPVSAGTYVVDHPNEIHYDGAKEGDCLLYIVGMGPSKTVPAEQK
jgi:quercetin dioxygenase-like cupin family protein